MPDTPSPLSKAREASDLQSPRTCYQWCHLGKRETGSDIMDDSL